VRRPQRIVDMRRVPVSEIGRYDSEDRQEAPAMSTNYGGGLWLVRKSDDPKE
jgi:hypothetical protein